MASTRAIRRSSTHGPFLLERLTCQLPLALATTAATDDVAVGRLVLLAGPVAQRRDAPRGDRMTARGGGPLAAAVRVVDGVHRRAARLRAHPQVALAAGLADLDVLVVGVADRAHGRPAVRANHAHLARRQTQGSRVAVLGHELDADAGRTTQLPPAAGLQLDVVDDRAGRHVRERQRVADGDVGTGPADHGHPYDQPIRRQDVALLAVGVVQQRDVGGAVGVVLDRRDLGRHAVLAALEVDAAVQALGPAAAVARGLAAVDVAPARLLEPLDERLLRLALRDLREVGVGREAAARTGRLGLADRHGSVVLLAVAVDCCEMGHGHPSRPWRPWKIGIVSPARTCTTAFFHERVRPWISPRRFGLDFTDIVRTSTTLTSKRLSTACRICVLCASGWTRKVYLSLAART